MDQSAENDVSNMENSVSILLDQPKNAGAET